MESENREEIISQKGMHKDAVYRMKNHCLIVQLGSDLDHHVSIHIKDCADRIIANENIRNIIFDFSKSNFMDSSGIGVIMGRYKQVKFMGGTVAVAGIKPSVDRIFKISGLYKIIRKYDTVNDALNAL